MWRGGGRLNISVCRLLHPRLYEAGSAILEGPPFASFDHGQTVIQHDHVAFDDTCAE
jgi:hypothetical protein